jgi:hypothetical protein
MRTAIVAATLAMVSLAAPASAQSKMESGGTLSREACVGLWRQATTADKPVLSEADVRPMVGDFKAVDTSGDGKIDLTEWSTACAKGLVNTATSTGHPEGAASKPGQGTK